MPKEKVKLKKVMVDKISRTFNLVFNQVSMYHPEHPAAVRSIDQFYANLSQGLSILPALLLIMDRDQLFIEEEPFDSRINTSKIAVYFKKADIQSITFDKDLTKEELILFIKVFFNLKAYPTVDKMKEALSDRRVKHIKINYVFFKKITSDEEISSKGEHSPADKADREESGDSGSGPSTEDILEMIAANVVFDEFEKTLSIQNVIENPGEFSRKMIEADLTSAGQMGMADMGQKPGHALTYQLRQFKQEVENAMSQAQGQTSDVNLQNLVQSVYDMKRQLLEGIEAQKANGIVYVSEDLIRDETDEITDKVMVGLIIKEYNKGSVSIPRLAQIILRIVPETGELQRLLPKLKTALLAEGMPLANFLQLIQELKNELQSDELSRVLEENAEEIGLDPEELIAEIMKNPKDAAELISLAVELRKGTGDEKALSDLLVGYVEKVETEMAAREAEKNPDSDEKEMHNILSSIRNKILGKLKEKNIDAGVISRVENTLAEKMQESIRKLQSSLIFKQISDSEAGGVTRDTILKILSDKSKDKGELQIVLEEVKQNLISRGVDENKFQKVFDDILEKTSEGGGDGKKGSRGKGKPAPKGTLNKSGTLYVLKNEVARSLRYNTPFSLLSFSLIKVIPKKPLGKIKVVIDDVIDAVLRDLSTMVRETDQAGIIDNKMLIVLQPMTDKEEAKQARLRITGALKNNEFMIKDIPFEIKLACITTTFDHERTSDLKSFLTSARTELLDISTRLSNIQEFF